MMGTENRAELAKVLVALYKGVVYRDADEAAWLRLLNHQSSAIMHFEVLGLDLQIDEAEGYAFLKTRPTAEGDELPRLVPRRQLTYLVSLVLALLRKKMAEADAGGGETRLIITREAVLDLVKVFLPSSNNEARTSDQVVAALNKVEELGFVRRLSGQNNVFEVRRILKAFVDAQWLSDFDERLNAYRTVSGGDL